MGLAGDKRVEMVLKMCNRRGLISDTSDILDTMLTQLSNWG